MRLSGLIYLYGRRLRTRPIQELLSATGIAIGVALAFAVQVGNSSITDASSAIVRGIAGTATLQLRSRSDAGFDERMLQRVQRLPSVARAAPVLDQSASLLSSDGRRVSIDLASAGLGLLQLNGRITQNISLHLATSGLILPSSTANALGLTARSRGQASAIRVEVRGRVLPARVTAILGPETIGALSGAMAALAPIRFVQRLTGLPQRVTRILVTVKPGHEAQARKELSHLAGGRLTVAAADQDVSLLKQALRPNTEATGFFVLVSALVGLLLAFNAMLLSVPERRRVIADLRLQGMRPWQLVYMLMFQAACLGVVASLLGLLAGDLLARTIFHTTPSYLATAFPLGTQTLVGLKTLVVSFVGGVAVTCIAAAPPLLDLRRGRAVDAVRFEDGDPGQALDKPAQARLFAAGLGLVLLTSGALIIWPSVIVLATVALALATMLAIPLTFRLTLALAAWVAAWTPRLNMLTVGARALRATTIRSVALSATGAIAVFGCVVAEDSHNDLLHGLYSDYAEYVSTANLWVVNHNDDLATNSVPVAELPARIAAVPGVSRVRNYQGGFLDFAGRRVWLIAREPSAPAMIPVQQVEQGNPSQADARLRGGGWITVSRQLAETQHLTVGDAIKLPTPSGLVSYRIAATTSNLGWSSGAIILNGADYSRAWTTSDITALEIDTQPTANATAVAQAVRRALGPDSALKVQTSAERASQADELARQGLSRMSQITLLLIAAAVLALAAAMGAGIWQRRASLAALRIESFCPNQLRQMLAFESILVLGTGAIVGAIAAAYGHLLSDRFLRQTTGFPAPFTIESIHSVETILIVIVGALIVLAIPGYSASEVPPSMALQE